MSIPMLPEVKVLNTATQGRGTPVLGLMECADGKTAIVIKDFRDQDVIEEAAALREERKRIERRRRELMRERHGRPVE